MTTSASGPGLDKAQTISTRQMFEQVIFMCFCSGQKNTFAHQASLFNFLASSDELFKMSHFLMNPRAASQKQQYPPQPK